METFVDIRVSETENSKKTSEEAAHASCSVQNVSLDSYVSKKNTLRAEMLWCLYTVNSNNSFHSNQDVVFTFQQMFPDSDLAKTMSCGETKSMYLSCFGIAPYFKSLVEKTAKTNPYVVMFDESLNKELQKKQIDILIRTWHDNKISSRYYLSNFLGHACAVNILDTFEKHIELNLGLKNIIQVSIDGPNVNWSFFEKLQVKIEKDFSNKLIDVGSCGLQILHNAFKAGISETKWDIGYRLSCLHTLFDNVPARREDFIQVSESACLFPLPFCSHRWLENVKVCQRALDILSDVNSFVDAVEAKKGKNPDTKSFDIVNKFCRDKFTKARLQFIILLGNVVERFLKLYQSDKPMLPFFANDLYHVVRSLMSRFIKSSIIEKALTVQKL